MYAPTRNALLALFRVDGEAPRPPAGAREVHSMRASPRWLVYRMIPLALLATLVLLVTAAAAIGARGQTSALSVAGIGGVVLALLLVPAFALRVDYDLRHYVITDRAVRVREGAWVVDEKTLSFANVQNVRVEQGPLQRLFGISDVHIDTAGGGAPVPGQKGGGRAHGVVLAGLDDAAGLRDLLLARAAAHAAGAGLGDRESPLDSSATMRRAAVAVLREVADEARALRDAARRAPG